LDLSQREYRETGKGLTYFKLAAKLPKLKQEFEWLKEADSQALQQALQNLARAFDSFFKGRSGHPRFRCKDGKQSFNYPQRAKIIERRENGWGSVYLPKIGNVRANIHREIVGRVKGVTVSLDTAGRYWASFLVDDDRSTPEPCGDGKAIGIDLGITHFAITSDGAKIPNPRFIKQAERNLRRKQKNLSRKKKGSISRKKAKLKVARAHEKVRRARTDFLHKVARRVVNENQVIAVENLNIKGLMRNHSLAKAIGDCSWASFIKMLSYKAEQEGKPLVKCHRFFPSSKTCSNCGHRCGKLSLDTRKWTCSNCGADHDRDINAAINIRDEGLRIWAEGHPASVGGGRVSRGQHAVSALPCETENRSPSG
jgi:putative transposase